MHRLFTTVLLVVAVLCRNVDSQIAENYIQSYPLLPPGPSAPIIDAPPGLNFGPPLPPPSLFAQSYSPLPPTLKGKISPRPVTVTADIKDKGSYSGSSAPIQTSSAKTGEVSYKVLTGSDPRTGKVDSTRAFKIPRISFSGGRQQSFSMRSRSFPSSNAGFRFRVSQGNQVTTKSKFTTMPPKPTTVFPHIEKAKGLPKSDVSLMTSDVCIDGIGNGCEPSTKEMQSSQNTNVVIENNTDNQIPLSNLTKTDTTASASTDAAVGNNTIKDGVSSSGTELNSHSSSNATTTDCVNGIGCEIKVIDDANLQKTVVIDYASPSQSKKSPISDISKDDGKASLKTEVVPDNVPVVDVPGQLSKSMISKADHVTELIMESIKNHVSKPAETDSQLNVISDPKLKSEVVKSNVSILGDTDSQLIGADNIITESKTNVIKSNVFEITMPDSSIIGKDDSKTEVKTNDIQSIVSKVAASGSSPVRKDDSFTEPKLENIKSHVDNVEGISGVSTVGKNDLKADTKIQVTKHTVPEIGEITPTSNATVTPKSNVLDVQKVDTIDSHIKQSVMKESEHLTKDTKNQGETRTDTKMKPKIVFTKEQDTEMHIISTRNQVELTPDGQQKKTTSDEKDVLNDKSGFTGKIQPDGSCYCPPPLPDITTTATPTILKADAKVAKLPDGDLVIANIPLGKSLIGEKQIEIPNLIIEPVIVDTLATTASPESVVSSQFTIGGPSSDSNVVVLATIPKMDGTIPKVISVKLDPKDGNVVISTSAPTTVTTMSPPVTYTTSMKNHSTTVKNNSTTTKNDTSTAKNDETTAQNNSTTAQIQIIIAQNDSTTATPHSVNIDKITDDENVKVLSKSVSSNISIVGDDTSTSFVDINNTLAKTTDEETAQRLVASDSITLSGGYPVFVNDSAEIKSNKTGKESETSLSLATADVDESKSVDRSVYKEISVVSSDMPPDGGIVSSTAEKQRLSLSDTADITLPTTDFKTSVPAISLDNSSVVTNTLGDSAMVNTISTLTNDSKAPEEIPPTPSTIAVSSHVSKYGSTVAAYTELTASADVLPDTSMMKIGDDKTILGNTLDTTDIKLNTTGVQLSPVLHVKKLIDSSFASPYSVIDDSISPGLIGKKSTETEVPAFTDMKGDIQKVLGKILADSKLPTFTGVNFTALTSLREGEAAQPPVFDRPSPNDAALASITKAVPGEVVPTNALGSKGDFSLAVSMTKPDDMAADKSVSTLFDVDSIRSVIGQSVKDSNIVPSYVFQDNIRTLTSDKQMIETVDDLGSVGVPKIVGENVGPKSDTATPLPVVAKKEVSSLQYFPILITAVKDPTSSAISLGREEIQPAVGESKSVILDQALQRDQVSLDEHTTDVEKTGTFPTLSQQILADSSVKKPSSTSISGSVQTDTEIKTETDTMASMSLTGTLGLSSGMPLSKQMPDSTQVVEIPIQSAGIMQPKLSSGMPLSKPMPDSPQVVEIPIQSAGIMQPKLSSGMPLSKPMPDSPQVDETLIQSAGIMQPKLSSEMPLSKPMPDSPAVVTIPIQSAGILQPKLSSGMPLSKPITDSPQVVETPIQSAGIMQPQLYSGMPLSKPMPDSPQDDETLIQSAGIMQPKLSSEMPLSKPMPDSPEVVTIPIQSAGILPPNLSSGMPLSKPMADSPQVVEIPIQSAGILQPKLSSGMPLSKHQQVGGKHVQSTSIPQFKLSSEMPLSKPMPDSPQVVEIPIQSAGILQPKLSSGIPLSKPMADSPQVVEIPIQGAGIMQPKLSSGMPLSKPIPDSPQVVEIPIQSAGILQPKLSSGMPLSKLIPDSPQVVEIPFQSASILQPKLSSGMPLSKPMPDSQQVVGQPVQSAGKMQSSVLTTSGPAAVPVAAGSLLFPGLPILGESGMKTEPGSLSLDEMRRVSLDIPTGSMYKPTENMKQPEIDYLKDIIVKPSGMKSTSNVGGLLKTDIEIKTSGQEDYIKSSDVTQPGNIGTMSMLGPSMVREDGMVNLAEGELPALKDRDSTMGTVYTTLAGDVSDRVKDATYPVTRNDAVFKPECINGLGPGCKLAVTSRDAAVPVVSGVSLTNDTKVPVTSGKTESIMNTRVGPTEKSLIIDGAQAWIVGLISGNGDTKQKSSDSESVTQQDAFVTLASDIIPTPTVGTVGDSAKKKNGPNLKALCLLYLGAFIDGVGYAPYPGNCQKLVQCFYIGGSLRTVERHCPFGMFWDQTLRLCRLPSDVACFDDKCLVLGKFHYPRSAGCRSYYDCVEGISVPSCCRKGFKYDVNAECVKVAPNEVCDDSCGVPDDIGKKMRGACPSMPDPVNKYGYLISEYGGIRIRRCPDGTIYSENLCRCTSDFKVDIGGLQNRPNQCYPEFKMNFDTGFRDISDGGLAFEHRNILIRNNTARFSGDGQIYIWSFTSRFLGKTFAVRLRVKPTKGGGIDRPEPIISNCGRHGDASVEIFIYKGRMRFRAITTHTNKMVTASTKYLENEWNDVTYYYNGKTFGGSCGTDKFARIMRGNLESRDNPLSIGSCDSDGFHGEIDDIEIYTECVPQNM